MRRFRLAVTAIIIIVSVQSAHAGSPASQSIASCRAHAPEAAVRSGLAVDVILRVMQAESGGSPSVVSVKGAMGCMQIMPATWTYLSGRYGLGNDPYDARMNMIAGAMYLLELARRFGWPGAFAAYNAGPARYARYVASGVPLPSETIAYAARLGGAAAPAIAAIPRARWQEARLFLDRNRAVEGSSEIDGFRLAAVREDVPTPPTPPVPQSTPRIDPTLFPLPLAPKAAPAAQ